MDQSELNDDMDAIKYDKYVREKVSDSLRQAQLVMLEILNVVDKICSKHNIKYWLDAGTLLGAVRHKGFIPWDDDLDICMLRSDFDRFYQIVKQELPDGLFFQTRETDKKLKWRWIKIRDVYSNYVQLSESEKSVSYHQGIFIDIFPYDGVDQSFFNAKIFLNRRWQNSKNLYCKKFSFLLNFMSMVIVKFLGYKRLRKFILRCFYSEKPKFLTTGIDVSLSYNMFCYETIFPLKQISFEGNLYWVPADSDKYLRQVYGDYMILPPIEKRKVHAFLIEPFKSCQHSASRKY